jgi:cytochrome c-type protein NapC
MKTKLSLLSVAGLFLLGVASTVGFHTVLEKTNTMEFCISCHTMQTNYREYQDTIHYKNPSGVQTTCADCHVPKEFLPKMAAKIIAVKDVYHEIAGTIDTPEKYEAHRWDMASRVWAKMEANDSRECRSCHDYSNMDLEEQDKSARRRHSRAIKDGETCIDCQ